VTDARTQPPTDRALIERLRAGDHGAADAVFARYYPRVLSYLTRMARRRDVAEDLLQETFLRLIRHAPRLAEDTRIEIWLLTVARNLCRSHFRSASHERIGIAKLEQLGPARVDSPHETLEGQELHARLERALGELSFEHREVLVLLVVEGLAQDSVATLLNVSPQALRQRYSRARKQLAEHLDALASQNAAPRKVVHHGQ
jgi:RNA polymerase sigma-70 factor (ECF subfamily)